MYNLLLYLKLDDREITLKSPSKIHFWPVQGFFIFLFYVLLKEDTRKFWLNKFKSKKQSQVTSNTGKNSDDKGENLR